MAGFNEAPLVQNLAVPAVCLLIAFLSYFSQYIFHYSTLDPGPPSRTETVVFNTLLLCLWYSYFKAVTVDPGRYVFPHQVIEAEGSWCKKCSAPKPPRAHHCRHCGRCIPKMDHHCPWTRNCVSMTTFPHFLRFLVYANVSLWTLWKLLWQRFYALWEARHLPAYLGPSVEGLIALALTSLICLFTTLALGIMLITTVKTWLFNCTMIEGWELDRHEAAIDRGGRDWWDITGPDGEKFRFERVEFPYDIGFFANMAQAMGTFNVPLWFFPLAGNPTVGKDGRGSGWTWEENGFNRKEGMWPPPDPVKIRQAARPWPAARRDYEAELREENLSPEEEKQAFKERQQRDARRRNMLLAELEEVDDYDIIDDIDGSDDAYDQNDIRGSPGWMNSDGERLRDYGVDEDVEDAGADALHDDEDDEVPLGELLRRRKVLGRDVDA
ncbi:Palmitoyltransferase [Tolypocladium capitatum]|uniref:Palmitoyltransferase PFA4 n=1 Tax=Tolypocladium capitatum TaxID=45235 RepID=A0A2K3QBK6_9HYPO|nr:Palmitoyltransferase [Tolypocladium capitatum]